MSAFKGYMAADCGIDEASIVLLGVPFDMVSTPAGDLLVEDDRLVGTQLRDDLGDPQRRAAVRPSVAAGHERQASASGGKGQARQGSAQQGDAARGHAPQA